MFWRLDFTFIDSSTKIEFKKKEKKNIRKKVSHKKIRIFILKKKEILFDIKQYFFVNFDVMK